MPTTLTAGFRVVAIGNRVAVIRDDPVAVTISELELPDARLLLHQMFVAVEKAERAG